MLKRIRCLTCVTTDILGIAVSVQRAPCLFKCTETGGRLVRGRIVVPCFSSTKSRRSQSDPPSRSFERRPEPRRHRRNFRGLLRTFLELREMVRAGEVTRVVDLASLAPDALVGWVRGMGSLEVSSARSLENEYMSLGSRYRMINMIIAAAKDYDIPIVNGNFMLCDRNLLRL
ncbi:hypothetical protein PAXRUDRAFT_759296 [Paxillus rubicundulus Ve08.2h10]|uniref:Uncharacterized protein n=1 Tax=Paxillus rubicundulus Ve08.2h10 TaxID=930991 RepID=A0A0D0DBD6_9AGAM|nr:hypothetical protein PAXRUDRAFT_759296 [Paxillus rubicundulus Ve08.2h10]